MSCENVVASVQIQAFSLLLFWFQLVNGYSGSNPIDGVNLFMYNLAYTSVPIIVVGVADQDVRAEVLLKDKSLYNQGRLSQVYTKGDFWISMLDAVWQSIVIFLIASSVSQWCVSFVQLLQILFHRHIISMSLDLWNSVLSLTFQ